MRVLAHLNPHRSDVGDICALHSHFLHHLTACAACKLRSCPSYRRHRDRINLGLSVAITRGGGGNHRPQIKTECWWRRVHSKLHTTRSAHWIWHLAPGALHFRFCALHTTPHARCTVQCACCGVHTRCTLHAARCPAARVLTALRPPDSPHMAHRALLHRFGPCPVLRRCPRPPPRPLSVPHWRPPAVPLPPPPPRPVPPPPPNTAPIPRTAPARRSAAAPRTAPGPRPLPRRRAAPCPSHCPSPSGGHNGKDLRLLPSHVMLYLLNLFKQKGDCEQRPRLLQRFISKPFLILRKYVLRPPPPSPTCEQMWCGVPPWPIHRDPAADAAPTCGALCQPSRRRGTQRVGVEVDTKQSQQAKGASQVRVQWATNAQKIQK